MKIILPLLLLSIFLFFACGDGKPKKAEEIDPNRKEFSKTVNLVDTINLRKGEFLSQLISNGKLRAFQKSDLSFNGSPGPIHTLNVVNGQAVAAGAVIAQVDTRNAEDAIHSARLEIQKTYLELQNKLLDFGYHIEDSLSIPAEVFRVAKLRSGYDGALVALEKAQYGLDNCFIKAPFSGKIANLKTKLHENTKGDAFCTLINDASFDVEFNVLETELQNVKQGQIVKVATFTDPDMRYTGRITNINPSVDEKGQIMVTANIPNSSHLIDGMNVKIYVENSIPGKLVVPKNAVLVRDNREMLFRMSPEGKAMWTYVVIEGSNSTSHAVHANIDRGAELNQGDVVIVSGNLNLADGSEVEIVK